MIVLKDNGLREDFDFSKLSTSISRAIGDTTSYDDSSLNLLYYTVSNSFNDTELAGAQISTHAIRNIISDILTEHKFSKIETSYHNYKKREA